MARRAKTPEAAVEQLDLFAELDAADAARSHQAAAEQARTKGLAFVVAAGTEVIDTAALAVLCRAQAEQCNERDRDDVERFGDRLLCRTFRDEARRLRGLADWLDDRPDGTVPRARAGWPCITCDAEFGAPCGMHERNGEVYVHVHRGFQLGFTSPGAGWGTTDTPGPEINPEPRCTPSNEDGPGNAQRGRCLGCGWRGPIRGDENTAVEDAHDHTHPGWRDLPLVESPPRTEGPRDKKRITWERDVVAAVTVTMGPEWLDRGGPIRTRRTPPGTRHVPGRAPGGGYDLAEVTDSTK